MQVEIRVQDLYLPAYVEVAHGLSDLCPSASIYKLMAQGSGIQLSAPTLLTGSSWSVCLNIQQEAASLATSSSRNHSRKHHYESQPGQRQRTPAVHSSPRTPARRVAGGPHDSRWPSNPAPLCALLPGVFNKSSGKLCPFLLHFSIKKMHCPLT